MRKTKDWPDFLLPGKGIEMNGRLLKSRLREWGTRAKARVRGDKLSAILATMGLFSGIFTYAVLAGWTSAISNPDMVLALFTSNLCLLIAVGCSVVSRLREFLIERRRAMAGSQLHARLIVLFSVVAITPALLVSGFSVAFFDYGLQAWFNEKVQTAIDESDYIAQSYLREHQQNLRDDVLGITYVLNQEGRDIYTDIEGLDQKVSTVADSRSIPEIVIFERSGQLRAKYGESFIIESEPEPPNWAFEDADEGKVALMTSENSDRVRALVRLDRLIPTYLYAGRFVDTQVLHRIEATKGAAAEYKGLLANLSGIENNFARIFLVVNLLLLMVVIWGGLHVATVLVHPLRQLIEAAERVRSGDMTARVPESVAPQSVAKDELSALNRAFNRMTQKLQTQRSELVAANHQLQERREFIETVLSGVSAGVMGLDKDGIVTLPNRSALTLLGFKSRDIVGHPLARIVPEMAPLLERIMTRPTRLVEEEIHLSRQSMDLTFLTRISVEHGPNGIIGYVITFDDISDLVIAQRKAAWADVARRVAHEIKNPLTPIQLSAERLKRKYLKQISTDSETFAACTETIMRQVGDIGRMVDEFSAFARMPEASMDRADLDELCRQSFLLQETAYPHIMFEYQGTKAPLMVHVDPRQISRLLTNLLKNAAESIERKQDQKEAGGHILLSLKRETDGILILVEDDGGGFPENRSHLTEPYVTTREKGTGLGLAIVMKIITDHKGKLSLEDRKEGGARVRVVFPIDILTEMT